MKTARIRRARVANVESRSRDVAVRASMFSRTVAVVLLFFFILSPIARVEAEEIDLPVSPDASSEVAEPATVETPSDEPAPEEVETAPADEVDDSDDTTVDVIPETNEIDEEVTDTEVTHTSDSNESSLEVVDQVTDTTTDVPENVATSSTSTSTTPMSEVTGDSAVHDEDDVSEAATTTLSEAEVSATTTQSTTEESEVVPSVDETTEIVTEPTVLTEDTATSTEVTPQPSFVVMGAAQGSGLSFDQSACVPMGNGVFQCVKRDDSTDTMAVREVVYTEKDATGDLEIMYDDGSNVRQITDNDYDDDAPRYDPMGDVIVWHAEIDDRYQVMRYDIESGETLRLTDGSANSMQPSVYDSVVAYQTWAGDDWEIRLIDTDGALRELTDNDYHDIAPSINGEYVTWQSEENGVWIARIYNRETEEIETVRGVSGGKVENPRMVLVFDNKRENGDVETLGYDPERGVTVPLASTPAPIPERIPEPAPEEEEKALIQPSTSVRTETKGTTTPSGADPEPENLDSNDGVPVTDTVSPEVTASTTNTVVTDYGPTIDMRPAVDDSLPDIPDLVIPPLVTEESNGAATST